MCADQVVPLRFGIASAFLSIPQDVLITRGSLAAWWVAAEGSGPVHLSLIGERVCLRSGGLKASAPQVVPLRFVITHGFRSLFLFDNFLTIGYDRCT